MFTKLTSMLVLGICLFAFAAYAPAKPETVTRINLFKDVVEAVGAAGDAIISLTEGFRELAAAGKDTYNYISAERDYNRLLDLSARSTNLVNNKQFKIVGSIDEYLLLDNPTNYQWDSLLQGLGSVIEDVKLVIDDVKAERSDFVLEESYSKFSSTLEARSSILQKISELPKPNSKEELDQLRLLNENYKVLIYTFREAIKQLNVYLKKNKNHY